MVRSPSRRRLAIDQRRRQAENRRIYQRLSALLWIDDGRTREEVAELLGVSKSTVQTHAERGMSKLRVGMGVTA